MLDIFQVGYYYYFIFNLAETRIEFCSESVAKVLGYRADEITMESMFGSIHPDDVPSFIRFESTISTFFNQLPVDKIMKYKVWYDYRIRNSSGEFIMILQQTVTAKSEEHTSELKSL